MNLGIWYYMPTTDLGELNSLLWPQAPLQNRRVLPSNLFLISDQNT